MSALTKRQNPNSSALTIMAGVVGIGVLIGLVAAAAWAGNSIQPFSVPPIAGLRSLLDALDTGRWPWNGWATVALLLELTALVGGAVWAWRATRDARARVRVDRAAKYMATGDELEPITEEAAVATADRLGTERDFYGLPVGESVLGRKELFCSVEELVLAIFGPRMGKTTSLAIPWILAAPGPMLATSNKRDLWDDTRDFCTTRGRALCFDLQNIANQKPTWYYDPLTYVVDGTTAAQLAEHFASGSSAGMGPADRYFDPSAQNMNAAFFLAAAIAGHTILQVPRWLTNIEKLAPEAVKILTDAGFLAIAEELEAMLNLTPKQRDGIVGTATQMVSCLKNEKVAPWVARTSAFDMRPKLIPEAFVRSSDSLFLLSKEGVGTATALVTALTGHILEAAEQYATEQGGRLAVPLIGVLDEAANVCRLQRLPDLYSHYGSRGILLLTILQNWSQGVEVWGETGMKKLNGAANHTIIGGNVKELDFLKDISEQVGPYEYTAYSVSHGPGGRNRQVQQQSEPILDPGDIRAFPKGRAILVSPGVRPVLVRTNRWTDGPHAAELKAARKAREERERQAAKNRARDAPRSDDDNPWLTRGTAA